MELVFFAVKINSNLEDITLKLKFAKKLAIITLGLFVSKAVLAEKLYIYNWTEYIPTSLLNKFSQETGAEIVYATFESNEEMYSKMKLTDGKGYDLVFPSTYYIQKMAQDSLLSEIDHSLLANFNNITKSLLKKGFDPENKYSLPYIYGLTGIGVNKDFIDAKSITSWQDLWDPKYKDKILLTNDSREVFHIALLLKGFSPNTTDENEIKQAYELLKSLIPNVLAFNSDTPEVPYLQGEVDLGMIWNGSAFRAHNENPQIDFIYPKEGVVLWMDNYAIPKNAQHKELAYKFIDFMLRPESAKEVIQTMGFSMPIEGLKQILDEKTRQSPIIFPSEAEINKAEMQGDVGEAIDIYEKYWNLLKVN